MQERQVFILPAMTISEIKFGGGSSFNDTAPNATFTISTFTWNGTKPCLSFTNKVRLLHSANQAEQ